MFEVKKTKDPYPSYLGAGPADSLRQGVADALVRAERLIRMDLAIAKSIGKPWKYVRSHPFMREFWTHCSTRVSHFGYADFDEV